MESKNKVNFSTNGIHNIISRPIVFVIIIFIIFLILILGVAANIFSYVILFILVLYIVFFLFTYVINWSFSGFFTNEPHLVVSIDKPVIDNKEVFNIAGNQFDYKSAKATCKAFNAELATYEQVEDAYNNGAEWCNYGWSEGQMALFPTQKKTFNRLQGLEGHEYDCGRQGVNGGYFEDASIKFGVNCYGKKPNMNAPSEKLMNNMTFYPENKQDYEMQEQVDVIKANIDDILINPFNSTNWKQY